MVAFEDVLARLSRRLADFHRSGRPDALFTSAAVADADELAPLSLSPGADADADADLRASACRLLGRWYFLRCTVAPSDTKQAELARSVTFLAAVAGDPAAIPDPLRVLLGPTASAAAQENTAGDLLRAAQHDADPYLLGAGIELMRAAAADDGDPRAGNRMAMLIVACQWRYRRTGRAEDLALAIETGERAIRVCGADHPELPGMLSNLGLAHRSRYERTGSVPDLTRSIDLTRTALAAYATGDPNRAVCLSNLGLCHLDRFASTGDLADLRAGIDCAEQALASTPDGHPGRARLMASLGAAYFRRYERTGQVDDLYNAISLAERAHTADPELPKPLSDLCVTYRERYQRLGDVTDLHRAVEAGERAFAAIPDGDPRGAAPASMLNLAYRYRYEALGDLTDLRRGIEYGRLAVTASPAGSLARSSALGNLSPALQRLYEHTGLLADLQQAIDVDEEALALVPDGHPMRLTSLSNLSVAYRNRANHTGASADRARAIELGEQSLAGIPADHPDRALTMRMVSTAYRDRFEHHRDVADLNRAIELAHLAIDALPADHPDRHKYLAELNIVYQRRFQHSADVADIRRGIQFQEQALACLPDDHPALATTAANLGQAHYSLATSGRPADDDRLRPLVDLIATSAASAPVPQRVRSYHVAGRVATVIGDAVRAASLMDAAATLLPSVAPPGAGLRDREYRIGQYTGLVRESISAHCAIDDPEGAVEAAELSRGVVLAAELAVGTDPVAAPRFAELRTAAADGAVVLVNTNLRRGEAVIVTAAADPVLVRLPDLGGAALHDHVQALIDVNQQSGFAAVLRRQRVIPQLLGWLWDVAVAPILAALPSGTPRVWWMPTDLLSIFPWHAAGHPGQTGALDAVLSSYTATLRTLHHARSRRPAAERRQLTVAVRSAPGATELPATATEAEYLHATNPDLPLLVDEDATTGAVLAALRASTWAHFACHADADMLMPSRSGILLHDGILSLSAISGLRLANADLAYLSACSTANPGILQADESLHLASAFQLAGFRHVIATLWPVADDFAATTARATYGHLDGTSADNAAIAVRRTTLDLRAEHPDRPDLWAALIHNGP